MDVYNLYSMLIVSVKKAKVYQFIYALPFISTAL